MFGVARFDREVEIGIFDGHIQKQAMMCDINDISASASDQGGDASEGARLICALEPKSHEAPFTHELTLQHDPEESGVDVSAA